MEQESQAESKSDAGILQGKLSETEILSRQGGPSSLQLYSVAGPHGQLRTQLAWVSRLLASDENGSVSAISLRELKEALLVFQREVRLLARGLAVEPEVSSRSRSSTRTNPRSAKARTRNFKN